MKKNKVTRLLAMGLSVVMLFSMAACGSKAEDTPATDTETKVDSVESADASDGEKKDLGTVTIMMQDSDSCQLLEDSYAIQQIEEATGVDIELQAIPSSDYDDKKTMMIATNTMADIMYVDQEEVMAYCESGVFLPLNDYIDEYVPNFKALMEEIPDIKGAMVDGVLYGFPKLFRQINRMGMVPMIRQDVMKELGWEEEPKTLDELYDLLLAMKEKYPDLYPVSSRWDASWLIECWAYPLGSGYGIYFDKDVDGGKWVYGELTDEFENALQYLNNMYEDGLLDPDYLTNETSDWKDKVATGKTLFYYDNPSFCTSLNVALKEINEEYEMGPIHIMENSYGQSRTFYYERYILGGFSQFVVAANTDNIEGVMAIFDYVYSEEGCNANNYGRLGETYEIVDGEPQLLDSVVEKYKAEYDDPWRAMLSDFGAGEQAFCPFIDERTQLPYNDEATNAWYEQFAADPGMDEIVVDPGFSLEEAAKVSEITAKLDSILEVEYDAFIQGKKDISEWDAVQQQLIDAGAEELVELYQTAYDRQQ